MGIADLIEWVGRLTTLAKKANQLELQEQLVKLRAELVGVQNEVIDHNQLIDRLREAAKLRPKVVLHRSAYWEWQDATQSYGVHPFCTRCFDVDALAVHLQDKPLGKNERNSYACPECKNAIPIGHWFGPPDKDPDGNPIKS